MAVFDEELSERMRFTPTEVVTRGLPATASDTVRLFPELIASYGAVVVERLRLHLIDQPQQIANVAVADILKLVDLLQQARDVAVLEGVVVGFSQDLQTTLILMEKMGLSEALQASATYQLTVTQAVRLTSRLLRFFGADIADELQLDDDMFSRVLAYAGVTDNIAIEADVAPLLLLNVRLGDGIDVTAEMAVNALFNPTIVEGIEIEAGYIGPDGSLTTWAMNTRTGAVTEYADFTFNSFARAGNIYLGAAASGLYELVGDDDDGEDIIARIRGGYMQFGGTRLSRLKAAYIAGRGTGDMILKIIENDDREYVYRATLINQRSSKVHMGKGQRSRYFAFELVTTGQDFDLDTLEFVPIVVQRRV